VWNGQIYDNQNKKVENRKNKHQIKTTRTGEFARFAETKVYVSVTHPKDFNEHEERCISFQGYEEQDDSED
jgi:ASC-1-like (ASCH) protein